MDQCLFCGATMLGDGSSVPYHCENCDPPSDTEPDAGPLFCEAVKKAEPRERFITGSSLVLDVEAKDLDVVCLFENEDGINQFAFDHGNDKGMYGDSKFISVRDGNTNYLCTADVEFFYRFKAYSGALSRLQLEDKADRVELAKACLYWECGK